MGAGQIVQQNVKSATTNLWNKVPTLPNFKWLDFDTSSSNKAFVNFAVIVGILTLAKGSLALGKTFKNSLNPKKLPSKKQLLEKYGYHSWVLIADCSQSKAYSNFFAEKGFNLVLLGSRQDITAARQQAELLNPQVRIEQIEVNWREKQGDITFYEDLVKRLQHFDVSFLILPKLTQQKEKVPTHLEHVQPFKHVYLLVRFFGQKLKWRSYKSAIIFPSYKNYEDVSQANGISKALIAGSDAFGRIINYELKNALQVVVARGSVENAIKGLGVQKITY